MILANDSPDLVMAQPLRGTDDETTGTLIGWQRTAMLDSIAR